MADIIDGTSNTIMASEILRGDGNGGSYTPGEPVINVTYGAFPSVAQASYRALGRPMRSGQGRSPEQQRLALAGGQYDAERLQHGRPAELQVPTCIAVNPPGMASDRDGMYPARSRHPGGVNTAMADGSVQFMTGDINWDLYQGLGTRDWQ